MPFRNIARTLTLVAALAAPALSLPAAPAMAQGQFDPVIEVNDRVITRWELDQRERMLTLLNAPGDVAKLAREQLVEDRLKLGAAQRMGVTVSDEDLAEGMEEFAGRANMNRDQFVQALSGAGVARQTFEDFVRAGVAWRTVVRQRFQGRVDITEGEVDRALASGSGRGNVRVLLSELIMPAPPQEAAAVRDRAARLSEITSITEFSQAARQYSATRTAGAGGRLPWQNLTDLPPVLQPLVIGLAPGEVTDPLPIPNAVALFQLRAIEETDYQAPSIASVEYAAYLIPGGRTQATLAQAARIESEVDTCDDLYGVAKGQPEEMLRRETKAPAEVPGDVAVEIAKLDPGEISYGLTRPTSQGQALMLVMLCARTNADAQDVDREQVTGQLQNQRLSSLADGYLAQLKADARIVER
ncbi:peptidylprolyl isomerase [Aquicoccus sp. SCR17]|nr:peptidylprolyl isomerase [Carideicomes alvinocaridis]